MVVVFASHALSHMWSVSSTASVFLVDCFILYSFKNEWTSLSPLCGLVLNVASFSDSLLAFLSSHYLSSVSPPLGSGACIRGQKELRKILSKVVNSMSLVNWFTCY